MAKVLVDNCIFSDANMLQGAKLTEYKDKDQTDISSYTVGYIRKPPLPKEQAERQKQIDWFPTIAQLSKLGTLELATYDELDFESWFRSVDCNIGNVFNECHIARVEPAIERSCFRQGDALEQMRPEKKVDFFKSLLNWTPDLFQGEEIKNYLPTMTRESIKSIDRFKQIAAGLSDEQLQDAFHLWTGEANDIPYFLTIDFKFIHVIRHKAKAKKKTFELICQPITPEELSKKFGIESPAPFRYSRDEFICFGGESFKINDYGKHRRKETRLKRIYRWMRQKFSPQKSESTNRL